MPSPDPGSEGHSTIKRKRLSSPFVVTSPGEREQIQEQWARAFYKNRWSFQTAEDPEFKKAMEMMRPGVGERLLTRKSLSGPLLDKEHDKIDGQMKQLLQVKLIPFQQGQSP